MKSSIAPSPKTGTSPKASNASLRDSSSELARILDDYLAAVHLGSPPSKDQLLARYPHLATELEACLASLEFLAQAAKSSVSPPLAKGGPGGSFSDALPGETGTLGDFRILREVGRGGMGVVYEAEQISLNRRVALKVLPFAATMDPRQLQRFHNEARAAASLEHPNIVSVYGVGCERGVHYYAMRFIEGQSLAEVIHGLKGNDEVRAANDEARMTNDEIRMTKERAENVADTPLGRRHSTLEILSSFELRHSAFFRLVAELGIQAAEALEYAHQTGIIHRDIKPANLLLESPLAPNPSPLAPKLWITDFGLAKTSADTGLTMTGDLLGTLRYMSPEQAVAKQVVDHRTDIYSLGVTLYELLTLQAAFAGTDRVELLRQIAEEEPTPPRKINVAIPPELETIILKAMDKERESRYQTAQEMADDLQRFLRHEPIRARAPSLTMRIRKWAWRHRGLMGTALVLLALTAIGSIATALLLLDEKSRTSKALQEADENFKLAKKERESALQSATQARRSLYLHEIPSAKQALERGEVRQALNILDKSRPPPGQKDVRGFEWHLLRDLCNTRRGLVKEFVGHHKRVYCVRYSPDGKLLASAGMDGRVRLWDVESGKPAGTLEGHTNEVNWVCFSPDGQTVATASDDGTAALWDATTQTKTASFLKEIRPVVGVAISPDGKWLAISEDSGFLSLWDLATNKEQWTVKAHTSRIESLTFSFDSQMLATGGKDHTAALWDTISAKLIHRFTHADVLQGVALTPDKRLLACAGINSLAFWNTKTFQPDSAFTRELGQIQSITFSHDGRWFATSGTDGLTRVWDLSGKVSHIFAQSGWCSAFSPSGKTLAAAGEDGVVRLWNLQVSDADETAIHQQPIKAFELARGGSWIAFAFAGRCGQIWDRSGWKLTGENPEVYVENPHPGLMSLSADGALLSVCDPLAVSVWDSATMRQRWKYINRGIDSVVFGPQGTVVAALSGSLNSFCGITGEEIEELIRRRENEGNITRMAISPSGTHVVYATTRGMIRLVDLAKRSSRDEFNAHNDVIDALAFSPDGRFFVSGARDRTIKQWDGVRGTLVRTVGNHAHAITGVAITPDGKTLATGCRAQVRLWDVDTGQEFFSMNAPDRAGHLAFAPDGKSLLMAGRVGDEKHGLRIWHAPTEALEKSP